MYNQIGESALCPVLIVKTKIFNLSSRDSDLSTLCETAVGLTEGYIASPSLPFLFSILSCSVEFCLEISPIIPPPQGRKGTEI